jgi:hypothetical protein
VQHVSISATAPFGVLSLSRAIQRAGMHVGKDDKPATAADGVAFSSIYDSIGADYFAATGVPILRGRTFTAAEATQPNAPAVAIIDEALARKLWPEGDALGQQIQFASDAAPRAQRDDGGNSMGIQQGGKSNIKQDEAIQVVGIAAVSRGSVLEKKPRGTVYLPFARGYQSNVFFFVQFSKLNPATVPEMADAVRRAVRETDPALPILGLKTFRQHLDGNMQIWIIRSGATLFSVFGGLALLLAIVGVYGVKAYSVARRTREIGIRMALGARPQGVQWMIVREGIVMLASGVAIGLLLAAATGRLLSGMLYQVGALDPIAFATAPLILGAATLIATWLPARRATRISPMAALRTE